MKKINIKLNAFRILFNCFLVFLLSTLLFSCGGRGSIKIKGNLVNGANQKIILKELTITEAIPIDSFIIENDGEFVLRTKNDKIAFYSLYLSNENNVPLILKPGDRVNISGDAQKLKQTYQIEGSEDSKQVKELGNKLDETLKKVDDLRKTYEDSLGSPNILKIRNNLDSIYNQIEQDHVEFTKAFIRRNLQSMASLMALYQQLGPRKPVLNPQDHFEFFALVDSSMAVSFPNADAVQSLHSLMIGVKEKRNRDLEIKKLTNIGMYAPEIVLPSIKGDTIKLSSFKGKYVLLDFWASWCNPCRQENPNLVKIFWKYRYAGFDILQVSLDKSKEAWQNAIITDKLSWSHVSDLQMWKSPAAALYGIESIPSNVLIDKEGVIIAKDLRGEELANKLNEIFKY